MPSYAIPSQEEMEKLRAKKAPKEQKAKPPCKWGPRDADGFCPPKPPASATPKAAKPAKAKPPCKYGPRTADGLCPKKPNKFSAGKIAEKVAGQVGGSVGAALVDVAFTPGLPSALVQLAKEKLVAIAGTSVAAAGGAAVGVALAGLAAGYFGTTYIMDRIAEFKEANTIDARRFHAATAYREARKFMAQQLGREITAEENKILGDQFKKELAKIGGG